MLHHFRFGPQPGLSPFTRPEMLPLSRVWYLNILPVSHPKASLTNTCRNKHQSIVNKCCVALFPPPRSPERKAKACTKKASYPNTPQSQQFPFQRQILSAQVFSGVPLDLPRHKIVLRSFFPHLEINALTTISKSVSKDLNSRLRFPSPGSL